MFWILTKNDKNDDKNIYICEKTYPIAGQYHIESWGQLFKYLSTRNGFTTEVLLL